MSWKRPIRIIEVFSDSLRPPEFSGLYVVFKREVD